jgi:hypothetical protein
MDERDYKAMNEELNQPLSKGAVSTRFSLVKMQERSYDVIKKYWHLVDASGVGGYEYTLCGKAYTDSTMHSEDFEFIEEKKGGKITCPLCIKHLNWCRSVK